MSISLSPNLREILARQPYMSLALALPPFDGDVGVLVKGPTSDIESLKQPGVVIQAGLAYQGMPTAPVVCLAYRFYDDPQHPFEGDTYLEVGREGDRRLMERLTRQHHLRFILLDERLEARGAKAIRWGEVQRREAQGILEKALADLEAIPAYNFEAAKSAFQQAHPLEEILGPLMKHL